MAMIAHEFQYPSAKLNKENSMKNDEDVQRATGNG